MPLFLSRADVCTTPQARWKSSIVCSCSNLCAYVRERSKVRQQEDTLDVSQPTWRLRKFSSSTRTFCHSGQNACACAAPLLSANVAARRDMTTTVPTQGFNEMVNKRLASCFQPKGLSVSHRYDSATKKYFWYEWAGSPWRGAPRTGRRRPPRASPVGASGDLLLMWWPNAEAF